jgi:RNA polymerase sigma-70 factor (ECF subfamily)
MTLPLYNLWCAVAHGGHDDETRPSRAERARPPVEVAEAEDPIVRQIQAGDAAAFESLVVAHFVSLVRFVAGLVHDRDMAEDIVQDTLTRVWERRGSFRPERSIRSYLYGAVRNRALNVLAHDTVRQKTAPLVAAELSDEGDEASQIDPGVVRALREALATLTERRRTAVRLRYEGELSYPEIAVVMGISTGSAEQLVFHAIRALRVALGRTERP